MLLKKLTPFIGKQGPVCLERIADNLMPDMRFLQFNNPSEKIYPQQGRLSPLPNEFHNRGGLGGDVIGYKGGEDLIRHSVLLPGAEEGLFFKIKAVLAAKVTNRTDRLGYDVDALGSVCRLITVLVGVHKNR
jgi:hypothetical protein